jgi:DNA-binding ferritin-like protein
MEELASILLHSQTQTHIFHLGVSGAGAYAAHKALQKYYESIDGVVDGLVETYQGKYGLIQFKPVVNLDNNCDTRNIIDYFDKLCMIVKTLRQAPNLADSYLQNQIDAVEELIYSTKYKLTNLQ